MREVSKTSLKATGVHQPGARESSPITSSVVRTSPKNWMMVASEATCSAPERAGLEKDPLHVDHHPRGGGRFDGLEQVQFAAPFAQALDYCLG